MSKAEQQLIAKEMGWKICDRVLCGGCDDVTLEPCGIFVNGELFDPFMHEHDLVRLMEKMRKKGWMFGIAIGNLGYRMAASTIRDPLTEGRSDWCKTFVDAASFAIIEGLKKRSEKKGTKNG
ncbi:hypothetical protein LCGC14_0140600 [marine sediment metagenome]|uniref:Uncharacterized protein n=1 Tax=marine sediment metagenome TaxID=412755 RepID=A0A0F9V4C3_9ZZZZ